MKKSYFLLVCACALLTGCKHTSSSLEIRINQVGFAPHQEKTATIDVCAADAAPCSVVILSQTGDTVWTGMASATILNPISSKPRQLVDFSALTTPGTYRLIASSPHRLITSSPFTISPRPYRFLTRQALRAFYHQRSGMATEEPYAEGYARVAGHPDNHVLVHPSAATDERPANTVIASHGGWYDAGDYNKYIVNSGYTMGVFLMAYEQQPAYYDTLSLNIPESSLPVPDMLAEAMYNIRWMLTMQDTDGGVYADITVESLHKTLFCLTQTAIIHLGDSLSHEREEKLMNSLAVFGTSSPSYLLMASIDSAVDHLIRDGERILGSLAAALSEFYKATESLEKLSVIMEEKRDPLKIVIMADRVKGKSEELVRLLRERNIEPEMVAPTYVLCMAGLGDTRESLERLGAALLEIDKILSLSEDNYPQIVHTHLPMRSGIKDPFDRNYREASFEKASGMISAEYLWAYPPGIPIITPGEIFDGEIIGMVKSYYESGLSLYSDKRGRIYCSDTLCVISD